jgi:ribosomal protein S18 acetylase RimI-like enzyme
MTSAAQFEIVLRAPRADEGEAVHRVLWESWFSAYHGIFGPERTAQLFQRSNSKDAIVYAIAYLPKGFVVAEAGGEIIGVAFGSCGTFGRVFLYSLYMHPSWQRRGVGRVLLEHLWEVFPAGASMKLEVLEKNVDGIRFYESLGFERLRRVRNARESGEPALLMRKLATPRRAKWWFPLALARRRIAGRLPGVH